MEKDVNLAYLKEKEKSQINKLTLHLKEPEKEQVKPKIRKKEIINIWSKINEIDTKKITERQWN